MSTVNPISSNITGLLTNQAAAGGESRPANLFANVLGEAMDAAQAADQADKLSTLALLAGEADSLSGVLIDAQKAELSLNLALQLRSKVLDAYKEIMSMQV